MDRNSLQTLPFYEKITASLLIVLFFFIIALNFYLDEGKMPEASSEPHFLVTPYVEITISGAVAKPGVYQVAKGSLLRDAIQMAEPLETANLKNYKLEAKITRRRNITIKNVTQKTEKRIKKDL